MSETSFAAALLDPQQPVPLNLVRPDGSPAPRRFDVYRNNVAVGLTEALRAGFPVVQKLVGDEFFAAMAGEFLRRHPPKGRVMMLYGDDFPGFLAGFPPVASLPYLPDVARLEQAMRESYHAADMAPLAAADLAALPESRLMLSRMTLAPALRLIRSPWPIHAIWLANMQGGPTPVARPEEVVILRPDFDPAPHLLPPGGADFLASLAKGDPLAAALAATGPDFNLTQVLTLLLNGRAITGIST